MATIVIIAHEDDAAASRVAVELREHGRPVVEVRPGDEALRELVPRAELVVVGALRPCARELALAAWLTGHARRLVHAPVARPACSSDRTTSPVCPARPECARCDRREVITALAARAHRVVEPSSRTPAALRRAVIDALALPELSRPAPASARRRFVVWGHAIGLGDSLSLLPMAHALAEHCERRPLLVVPAHHVGLLQSAWPDPLVVHEAFDPRTVSATATILEITVGQSSRYVGRAAARLVHLDLSRQAGGDGQVHERLLGFLARAGIGALVSAPHVPVLAEERERAVRRLAAHGLDPARERLVAVHPGASRAAHRWPAERYASLVASMRAELDARVVLVLGLGEDELRAPMGEVSLVSAHEGLREVAALVGACRAFVGNDSGLSHLAAAVGVPTVTIFGPMSPRIWRPAHPRGRVVDAGGDVRAVEPSQVLAAVRPLLEEPRA